LGNIPGTFREHSENIQNTMHCPDYSLLWECRSCACIPTAVKGTFREHSGNIRGAFREHSQKTQNNMQGTKHKFQQTLSSTFVEIYASFLAYCSDCSLNVPWMLLECSLNVHRMFPECSLHGRRYASTTLTLLDLIYAQQEHHINLNMISTEKATLKSCIRF
jgi:hypothetical protein